MCNTMENMIANFVIDDRKEAAIRMLERGKMTREEIAEDLKLSVEVVEELANSLQMV